MSIKNHPSCMHEFASKDELLDAIDCLNSKISQCRLSGMSDGDIQAVVNEYHRCHSYYPLITVHGMRENKYEVPCKKCGSLFNSFDHDSDDGSGDCSTPYVICFHCNNEFWHKWYALPECQKVGGEWVRTEAHNALIREYFKERHFGMD